MKFAECNAKQKKAWKNVKYAASDYIFGLMNGCLDNPKDSTMYKDYMDGITDLDGLISTVYDEAITNVYDEGYCAFGAGAQAHIRDIRFCGKDFIMGLVTRYCTKYQQEALDTLN